MKTTPTDSPLKCNKCSSTFRDQLSRNWHVLEAHAGISKLFCPKENCDATASCFQDMEAHLNREHKTSDDALSCEVVITADNDKETKCNFCDEIFLNNKDLWSHKAKRHIKVTLPKVDAGLKTVFLCFKCDQTFPSQNDLLEHMSKAHMKISLERLFPKLLEKSKTSKPKTTKEEPEIVCLTPPPLNKLTLDRPGLTIERISKQQESICHNNCGAKFDRKYFLYRHILDNHRIADKKYKCNFCQLILQKPNLLENHLADFHVTPDGQNYQCRDCHMICSNSKGLVHHLQIRHGKKFPCPLCQVVCPSAGVLKTHLVYHVNSREPKQKMKCDKCNLHFANQSILVAHIRQVHLEDKENEAQVVYQRIKKMREMKTKCTKCNMLINNKDFIRHIQVAHMGVNTTIVRSPGGLKPSVVAKTKKSCTMCKGQVESQAELDFHIRKHHAGFRPTPLKRNIPPRGVKRTGSELSPPAERQRKCPSCEKCFTNQHELNSHVRNFHTRPMATVFICEYCDRNFRVKTLLLNHKKNCSKRV